VIALVQVIDIADASAGLNHLHGLHEGLSVTAGNNHSINSAAQCKNLVGNVAHMIIDDLRRTVFPGQRNAVRARAHRVDLGRSVNRGARHAHQPNRTDSHDGHGIAKLHPGQLHAVEPGRHHVRQHAGGGEVHSGGQQGEVSVRVVDVEELRENSILGVRKLPAAQQTAGVHRESRLRLP